LLQNHLLQFYTSGNGSMPNQTLAPTGSDPMQLHKMMQQQQQLVSGSISPPYVVHANSNQSTPLPQQQQQQYNTANNSNNNNNNASPPVQYVLQNEPKKKRKRYSKKACTNCKKAHSACNDERPCKRCTEKGIQCIDMDELTPEQQQQLAAAAAASQKRKRSQLEGPAAAADGNVLPTVPAVDDRIIQEQLQQYTAQLQLQQLQQLQQNNNMNTTQPPDDIESFLNFADDNNSGLLHNHQHHNESPESQSSSGQSTGAPLNEIDDFLLLDDDDDLSPEQQQQQLNYDNATSSTSALATTTPQQGELALFNNNNNNLLHITRSTISPTSVQQYHHTTSASSPISNNNNNTSTSILAQQQQQSALQIQQAQLESSLILIKQLQEKQALVDQVQQENQLLRTIIRNLTSAIQNPPVSNNAMVWNKKAYEMQVPSEARVANVPVLWNEPMQFTEKSISFWDKTSFMLLGCNSAFASMIGYHMEELQQNFSMLNLFPKNAPVAFFQKFLQAIVQAKAKTVSLKLMLTGKHDQKIALHTIFHLESSFFWCEQSNTDKLNDELIMDDKLELEKANEIDVTEFEALGAKLTVTTTCKRTHKILERLMLHLVNSK